VQSVVAPSRNCTLPAFTVDELLTVAVKVTELPCTLGFKLEVNTVVVAKAVTTCDTEFEVDALKFESPP
jgi:hypothetical protein